MNANHGGMRQAKKNIMKAALAACVAAAPVQAAPTAQEIFTQLAQPEPLAQMQIMQRAAALPALAMLPAESDAVFAAAEAGQSAAMLAWLFGCPYSAEVKPLLHSVSSFAVSAAKGSAGAFERALPAYVAASQLISLAEWRTRWSEHTTPSFVQAIQQSFLRQESDVRRNLLATLADCHPKPLYAALAAVPGREGDFKKLCGLFEQLMQRAVQGGKWQAESLGNFRGIRTTQLQACKMLTGAEPENEELRQSLARRELHLLMRAQEGTLLLVLCEQPGEVNLPAAPEDSLLYSPLLAEADAHMTQLRAAAWVSPVFFRALQACCSAGHSPLTQAAVQAFRSIGEQDPSNQQVFQDAVRDALLLDSPTQGAIPTRPMTMQVWQPEPGSLRVRTSLDAWGAQFAPGELRLTSCATSPGSVFYAESTALDSPYLPRTEGRRQALMGVGRAVLLSLRDTGRDALIPYLRSAEMLAPDAQAMEGALRAVTGALRAPLAIVSGAGAAGEDPAVAVCAEVKDRAALAEGWRQFVLAAGHALGRLGLPPSVVTDMPVESRESENGSVVYELRLPFLPERVHPSLALSDSYAVLGYSPTLCERLLAAASVAADRLPFSGAVCAVSFPGWARTARIMTQRSGRRDGAAVSITRFLERLASIATLYLHSSTIRNGAIETNALIHLPKN